ncbi:MAG: hypothetical protein A2293_08555 [Elusimicrobia bacterium RIFOXYB2_FULL_49_7]|nr:MAG: hypothetical protein A2293_08555 [Elusimicrobia bacterium RIFOXYB2_FULL_49_7]
MSQESGPRKDLLKIGEVAEKTKLPVSKIRYYTDLKIIDVAAYTDGGQYLYDEKATSDRINHIEELSKRGLSLQEIKEYILGHREKKKVVVIDDDSDFVKMVEDAIQHAHGEWEVRSSTNVFEAGHVLTDFLPDLVILDLFLPGVKGFEISKFIRSNQVLKHTKILAVSAHDTKKNVDEINKSGADAFMAKPINFEKFLAKVDELTKKNEQDEVTF